MKLENKEFGFDSFATEMARLKNEKHFDYLVTVVGEDFGAEEGLGCIYILENTKTHERCSVKQLAKKVGEERLNKLTMIVYQPFNRRSKYFINTITE